MDSGEGRPFKWKEQHEQKARGWKVDVWGENIVTKKRGASKEVNRALYKKYDV